MRPSQEITLGAGLQSNCIRQRASVDVDVLTTLPQSEMRLILEEISKAYGAEPPYLQFEPFIPDESAAQEVSRSLLWCRLWQDWWT